MIRRALMVCLAGLATQAWAGDTGALWLRPDTNGSAAEIVIRRSHPGPMPFTITSLRTQVLDKSFRVLGPFGVPVYTVPGAPHVFGPGETSITATSLVLIPGEYKIIFGDQGLFLKVSVPGSPLVLSGFAFGSDATLMTEPVVGDYTFYVPAGTTSFGFVPDVVGVQDDDYLAVEIRDGSGALVAAYACGENDSLHPSHCSRIRVDVPEGRSGEFWQLHLVHNGSMVIALDTIPSVLSIQAADWFEPHRFFIDPAFPGGRDCLLLGGAWDAAQGRCAVADWEFHAADTLEILETATLVLDGGTVRNAGAIVNRGTLISADRILSVGTIFNHGLFENHGALTSGGTLTNLGVFANHGHLTNTGTLDNSGVLQNFCSGTIDGGGVFQGADPIANGQDLDGDGVCQKADCAPEDPALWTLPGEVGTLTLTRTGRPGATALNWAAPAEVGGAVAFYDVLRTDFPDFAGVASCIADSVSASQAADDAQPAGGQVFYYVVVAENGCGRGSAGMASDGTPRPASGCD